MIIALVVPGHQRLTVRFPPEIVFLGRPCDRQSNEVNGILLAPTQLSWFNNVVDPAVPLTFLLPFSFFANFNV